MIGLNWGCGAIKREGWFGSDITNYGQAHVGDIRDGLPWADETFDVVLSNHSLPSLTWHDVIPALVEMRRVTKPGGMLRVIVPDVVAGFRAWERGHREWFPVGDDLDDVDRRFTAWLTWFGENRTPFTPQSLMRDVVEAGWRDPILCVVGTTAAKGRFAEVDFVVGLDDRADESFVVEATR